MFKWYLMASIQEIDFTERERFQCLLQPIVLEAGIGDV